MEGNAVTIDGVRFPSPWRLCAPRLAGRYHLTAEQGHLREAALDVASKILHEVRFCEREDLPSIDVQVLKQWSPREDGQPIEAHALYLSGWPEGNGVPWGEIRLWWWDGREGAPGLDELLRHELAHWYCDVEGLDAEGDGHGSAWMLAALGFGCEPEHVALVDFLERARAAKEGEEWEDNPQAAVRTASTFCVEQRGELAPMVYRMEQAYKRLQGVS